MEGLLLLTTTLTALLVLGVSAIRFGADSRDGFVDDWARPIAS
jgi:hypothetical protein